MHKEIGAVFRKSLPFRRGICGKKRIFAPMTVKMKQFLFMAGITERIERTPNLNFFIKPRPPRLTPHGFSCIIIRNSTETRQNKDDHQRKLHSGDRAVQHL